MSGYLHKKAGATLHLGNRWQKRYFCLLGRWLVYYRSEKQAIEAPAQVQGAYDLAQVVTMGVEEDDETTVRSRFHRILA